MSVHDGPEYTPSGPTWYSEPNCKPNYLSVMSYSFQLQGLRSDVDGGAVPHLHYSHESLGGLDETNLVDGSLSQTGPSYRSAWFFPVSSPLGSLFGIPAATKHCDGSPLSAAEQAVGLGRIAATSATALINWNGNGSDSEFSQDIDFDGSVNGGAAPALQGFDDWAHLHLNQIGARRTPLGFSLGLFDGNSGVGLFGDGGVGVFGDGGFNAVQKLDTPAAANLGYSPPNNFTACILGGGCLNPWTDNSGVVQPAQPGQFDPMYHRVYTTWTKPDGGEVAFYSVFRIMNDTSVKVLVGSTNDARTTTGVDTAELPNGVSFTYFVTATFDDSANSPNSNLQLITAVNDAPVALAEGFTTNEDTPLTDNVLTNDTDDDTKINATTFSPLKAVLVTAPLNGTLTSHNIVLTAGATFDGSFTFTPASDFEGGPTSFTYKANDGLWTDSAMPMSPDSNVATVTITKVFSRHTTTSISPSSPNNTSVYGDSVTFTATVTPDTPVLGLLGGTVTFKDGLATLGTGTIVGGQATFATSSLQATVVAHSITATYSRNSVFYGSTSSTLSQTVAKADLTVTADANSRVYGAANPPFTAKLTGFVLSQTLGTSGVTGSASFTSTATAATNADTYGPATTEAITCTQGTLAASNYDFTPFVNGTLTIDKATPTIAVAFTPSTVTYDGNGHTAVATVIGANSTTLHGPADGAVTISYKKNESPLAGTPTDAASYTASAHFASTNGNYNNADTTSDASLAIAKADATISVTAYDLTYDGLAHTATGSAKGVKNEDLAGLDLSGTTHTPAGTFADTATFTDAAGNYNNTTRPVTDKIAKAPVTATAGGGSTTYDAATHAPSACAVTPNSPNT